MEILNTTCSHDNIFSLSPSEQCNFVSMNCGGDNFNFYKIQFCYLPSNPLLSYSLIFLLVFAHMFFLSDTGSKEVSYPLEKIVSYFNINQNIAGLTLLAIGNGAPDVISSIVASADAQGLDMTFGALIGAGCFTTCLVVSSVVLSAGEVSVHKGMYLRDILIYLLALGWVTSIFYTGKIRITDGLFLISLYGIIVFIAVVQIKFHKKEEVKRKDEEILLTNQIEDKKKEEETEIKNTSDKNTSEMPKKGVCQSCFHEIKREYFLSEEVAFGKKTIPSKLFHLSFVVPISIIKKITIPEIRDEYWSKFMFVISPFTSFLCIIFVFKLTDFLQDVTFFFLSLIILSLTSVFFLFCTTRSKPPSLVLIFCLYSFIMSMLWVWFTATNLIDLLKMIGVVLNLPESFLGMTLLALGNSVCDLSLNSKLAREGFGEMALAGSLAGPMFNLLIGLGLGLLRISLTIPEIHFTASMITKVAHAVLVINLLRLGVQGKLYNFVLKKWVAYLGFIIYTIYCLSISIFTFFVK